MSALWLSLRDLQYLDVLARVQHFGKAARECHVSQPALSGQIKKIEETLGVQIFERNKRRVAVTPRGEEVVSQARAVLDEAQKLMQVAKGTEELLAGPFRLGAIATVGPYLMPHLLTPLRKAFPKLKLILQEGLTESLVAQLKSGQLDAILASPTFNDDSLSFYPLYREPFVLACAPDHPLLQKQVLRRSDLNSGDMVLLEDGHCLSDQTLQLCSANRRGKIQEFHATSVETLRHLVACGLGYTLLPNLAAQSDKRMQSLLKYREFDDPTVGRDIGLYCRKRSANQAAVQRLAQFIRGKLPAGVMAL